MGCCSSQYSRLSEEISLADRILPQIPSTTSKIRDLTASEKNQLQRLFEDFDRDNEGHITLEDFRVGLLTYGKSPSKRSLERIIKQAHLSSAPKDAVDSKGFMLAICSRRSLIWEFLYTEFDTIEELEKESMKKNKGWRFGV